MIVEGQKIEYRNVISKYYTFIPAEIQLAIDDFFEIISENRLTPDGPFFYSINTYNQKDTSEPILAEFFLPVKENNVEIDMEILNFRSYFAVSDMIMTRIDHDFENETLESYGKLLEYIDKQGMELTAPFFHLLKVIDEKSYMQIYLGATRIFEYQK